MIGLLICAALAVSSQDTVATGAAPVPITLEQALKIALSESPSVKIADKEIQRTGYSRRGTYSALFPVIDGSANYQRTIKKQVMYMDIDMGSIMGGGGETSGETSPSSSESPLPTKGGIEVGRWNTWSAGVTAAMPLVNAQLWKSLKISDVDVELSVEKARSSRLQVVEQVKQAYFVCLLARDAFNVYKGVYENAVANLNQIQKKYNVQKASELELTRAKTTLANAVPNVYDAESAAYISLWQLKAVMGINLEENIDVTGTLGDYSDYMFLDLVTLENEEEGMGLDKNSTLKQLALQAEQLSHSIKLQQYANIPSLALAFSFNMNAMTNDFKFNEFQWSPYSYAGLSLSIPIFAGGKRASAIKQAKIQAQELDIQRENTERQLKIAIRQDLNTMETATKSYSAAVSAVESATKAYSIAVKSYDVGRSTLTDLNDAQLALTQAQLSVSQAIYNFLVAKANLEVVLGADFTEDVEQN